MFPRKPPRRPQPGPSARQFRMNIEPDRIHHRSSLTAILGSHLTSVGYGVGYGGCRGIKEGKLRAGVISPLKEGSRC